MPAKIESVICWKCHEAAPWQPTCRKCGALRAVPKALDHFALLGLPRKLVIDAERLQARYYELSRQFHPDLHQQATPQEQAASLANTAALNQAQRTLRDPVLRGLYWLELYGEHLGKDNNRVPPALAARVSDALVPLIRDVHGPAPLAPAESMLPATSATVSVVSANKIRIRSNVRRAPERSCRLLDG